jgi:peptidoglycan/LPS O-acetylase OafA/YrhL
MRKILAIAAIAVVTVTSSLIATTNQADAQFRRWGPAAIAGAFVAGAVIANSGPYYYGPPRSCWARQFDRWGNYMGRVWVCN